MTVYGYARVSVREPEDKNLDLQVERLARADCSIGNTRAEEAAVVVETSLRPRRWARMPPGGGRQRRRGYGRDCSVAAPIGCSLFLGGFLFPNHYPKFRGAPSGFFKGCPQGRPSVDSR